MIIKGSNSGGNKESANNNIKIGGNRKILKAGEAKAVLTPANSIAPNENNELTIEKAPAQAPQTEEKAPEKSELELIMEEFENAEVELPEFKERYERRRGERRRGFRRIDERALVSRAQEEARNIREIAAKEGYKNGLSEAQNDIAMIKTSLNEFVGARQSAFDEMSEHILEIALEIAKKIIKKEVELSNDVLKAVMGEVFLELGATDEKVTVKVNPEDVEFAKASLPEILADCPIDAKVVVIGDELVEKGSCTVMASNGVVDANFTTQLSIIQNAFGIYKGGE